MERVIHRAESRGFADSGWRRCYFNFSFANYYDPRRINFGALRVLNEVTMLPGEGMNAHPHDNMEIVAIPLQGTLEYGDNMGNMVTLTAGQADVISADQALSTPLITTVRRRRCTTWYCGSFRAGTNCRRPTTG